MILSYSRTLFACACEKVIQWLEWIVENTENRWSNFTKKLFIRFHFVECENVS